MQGIITLLLIDLGILQNPIIEGLEAGVITLTQMATKPMWQEASVIKYEHQRKNRT